MSVRFTACAPTLIERSEILLLGSANAFFEAIGGYGEPLYEFFRVIKLEGIGQEEASRILEAAASSEGRPEVSNAIDLEQGRLETIRRLTGGNPRLLSLACRLLIESPLGSAIEDLERLIDEQTPYFKARESRTCPVKRARSSTVWQRDGNRCLLRR